MPQKFLSWTALELLNGVVFYLEQFGRLYTHLKAEALDATPCTPTRWTVAQHYLNMFCILGSP